ncbi:transmembrane protein 69-like [Thrips palmi]|uniref:Transmembrane protein 69-like n=1 Tax=Thrips palmi TaxID=161013 RepID=A0A6P8YRS9_THRPL|nr:transmembrane protein 69-like [Thrips palmi]XP_034239720.1 transmembrane protein 69-like [Thrips palmi]XP_034239721.1 transmembrane protein 69-like [Thrips palmi]XP_034239722.1 transmembrane protein 69-like [Thrips palmi]XP_034239723.1 transmembrane protein 69-like [Thrips palmi]XP_034239724.1 transmembrane protein 69-like [Thrips palmi]XP_034239725.1 transmembrane protein 69-like [Thrips palmi]
MFKFAAQRLSSTSLLNCSKVHAPKLACSATWSHLAPLSVSGTSKNPHSYNGFLQTCGVQNFETRSLIHSSSVNNKPDVMDEFQKRYKHMLSQVSWQEVKKSPQPALAYGAAGLIPFVFPPLAILLNGEFLPNLGFVQLAYGASILSFLGGVKWGFAVPENSQQKLSWDNLGQSVSLSLVAFGSLILPPWIGTLTLVAGMGASAYIDITSPGYPQWFKAMRLCLSGVAIGSLLFGWLLRILL